MNKLMTISLVALITAGCSGDPSSRGAAFGKKFCGIATEAGGLSELRGNKELQEVAEDGRAEKNKLNEEEQYAFVQAAGDVCRGAEMILR
jgi:hypothetical protein